MGRTFYPGDDAMGIPNFDPEKRTDVRYWLIVRCVLDGVNSKFVVLDKILYEGDNAKARADEAAKIISEESRFLGGIVIPG